MAPGRVKAGEAFIKLSLDRKGFKNALNAVMGQLKRFGSAVASVGKGLAVAFGTAAIAGITASVKQFTKLGDQLDKMSKRTGFSVESLGELKFAMEQSGQNAEQLEKVIIGMTRQLRSAERGLSTASEALEDLGLTYEQVKDLAPEDQFLLLAERLAAIEDPTRRAGIAMDVFGRSGRNILPMLTGGAEGIKALRDQAKALGAVMTTEQATQAAALVDAWNRLKTSARGLGIEIASRLAPSIISFVDRATEFAVGFEGVLAEIKFAWAETVAGMKLEWTSLWNSVEKQAIKAAQGLIDTFGSEGFGNMFKFFSANTRGRTDTELRDQAQRDLKRARKERDEAVAEANKRLDELRKARERERSAGDVPLEDPITAGAQAATAAARAISGGGFAGFFNRQARDRFSQQMKVARKQLEVQEDMLKAIRQRRGMAV